MGPLEEKETGGAGLEAEIVEIISPTEKELTVPSSLVFKNEESVIASMHKYFDQHFSPMRTNIETNSRNQRIRFKCPKGIKNNHTKAQKNKENKEEDRRTARTAMYDRCEAELVFKMLPDGTYYLFSGHLQT